MAFSKNVTLLRLLVDPSCFKSCWQMLWSHPELPQIQSVGRKDFFSGLVQISEQPLVSVGRMEGIRCHITCAALLHV